MPRHRLAVLVLAAACVFGATRAQAAAAPANLLLNPGFEQSLPDHPWMPAGWDTSRAGLPSVFFGRDTLVAHGGQYAVSVANLSQLIPMAHNWSQRLVVDSKLWGKDLVFSVWTKTNSLDGRAYILLQAYRDTVSKMAAIWHVDRDSALDRLNMQRVDDDLFTLGWARSTFSEPETGWVKREVRVFCPPSVNVVFVRVGMLGTGQVLIDDASLTAVPALAAKAPKPGENLLADPGFEGDCNAWEFSMPPFEGTRIDRDDSMAHGGKASIRMASGIGQFVLSRTGVCQVVCNRALAGKRVRLSGWVRTDSLDSKAYLKIYAHTMDGVKQVPPADQFSHTVPWTKTSLEMDLPSDTFAVWAWFCYDGPRAGLVHFDDCSLEVLGPSKSERAAR